MEIESYRDTNPDTQAVPSKAWVLFAVARMSRRFKLIFWCFNATFNNISAISWRPVLAVEEAGVPGENHRPTCKLYHLRLRVECTLFCNLQSRRVLTRLCTYSVLFCHLCIDNCTYREQSRIAPAGKLFLHKDILLQKVKIKCLL
jgi:hypothetical protein